MSRNVSLNQAGYSIALGEGLKVAALVAAVSTGPAAETVTHAAATDARTLRVHQPPHPSLITPSRRARRGREIAAGVENAPGSPAARAVPASPRFRSAGLRPDGS